LRGASVSLFDQSYHISMAKRKSFPITKNWKNLPGNCEMILPKQKFFFGWN
jgi:hypothetical protein